MARRWLALVSLLLSFLLSAIAGWHALHVPPWRTGGRVMPWYAGDGQPVAQPENRGYRSAVDIGMRNLVFGKYVWTWTEVAETKQRALVRIDSESAEGRVLWPAPDAAPFGGHTVGIFPRGNNTLGVVYRIGTATGPLAAGVAGPDGWLSPPVALPGKEMSRLLAGAWVDDALELVVVPHLESFADLVQLPPRVLRVTGGKFATQLPFVDRAAFCGRLEYCSGGEGAQFHDGRWRFLTTGNREGERSRAYWVRPGAELEPTGWKQPSLMLSSHVDFVSVGLLQRPVLSQWQFQGSGQLKAPEPVPRPGWEPDFSPDFIVREGRLERLPSWTASMTPFVRVQRVGGRLIGTNSTYGSDPPLILSSEYAEAGEPKLSPMVHAPSYACGDLSVGTFVEVPGGFTLVARDGCFVRLDSQMVRLDPLPLQEHLRRRGSLGMDWNERRHGLYLAFAVFGLPLMVSLVFAFLSVRSRAVSRAERLRQAFIAGSLGHVVLGLWAIGRLLPLLR